MEKAGNEILALFSSAADFHRQARTGLIDFLIKKTRQKAMTVRILAPMDDEIKKIAEKLGNKRIMIRGIEPQSQTRLSIAIVDRKYCLSAELRDDTKESSLETIGFGSYSNSKSTVLSYVSIFETLWIQADLYQKLREANSQLQWANDILQNNDKMQKEFINIAAHELRTPIQPILGLSQALRDNSGPADRLEFLDAIVRNARRLHKLSEDILQVSRIESNLLKLNCEEFDLAETIDDIIKAAENSNLRNGGVKFTARVKKIRVFGDRNKIGQVIGNLVDNAMKFTTRGTITVEARKTGERVTVSVKDSGRGIHPDLRPRLFTKFASKSDGGTGLGLYICKNIVEAHGGKIYAENNRGAKGATFSFTIPVKSKRPLT